jgi:hypothetical protein
LAEWHARYVAEFGQAVADHYVYPHDPVRNERVIREAAARDRQLAQERDVCRLNEAVDLLAQTAGLPASDIRRFLLARAYGASMTRVLKMMAGRPDARVLRACTAGDPSVGINGDEMFLVFGVSLLEDLDPEARDQLRKAFEAFASEWLDSPAAAGYSDECPDCGEVLDGAGKCAYTHCPSNRKA